MKTLISIDPGWSTGLVIGAYSDTEPFEVIQAYQFSGGLDKFLDRVNHEYCTDSFSDYYGSYFFTVSRPDSMLLSYILDYGESDLDETDTGVVSFIAEKFNARGSGNQGFRYTTKSLEPLRIEGAILAMGISPIWVQPPQQYFLPGEGKAEKKKKQHAWLKENGYYISPKSVGQPNADDARSALAHAISWLRRNGHKPTQDAFKGENENSN